MLQKKIELILERSGVFPIAADGEVFDPQTMIAMEKLNNPAHPDHIIVETVQKGYLLNNRVLRLAKVKVNSTEPAS